MELQCCHFVLGLGNAEPRLIGHVFEFDRYFRVVEIGVAFPDVAPVIVRMRQGHGRFEMIVKADADVMVLIVVHFVVAVVDLLRRPIAHLCDFSHVVAQGSDELVELVFQLFESLHGHPLAALGCVGLLHEAGSGCLVLEDFDLCLQLNDLPFHFLLRLVNLRQLYLAFLQVHRVLVQQLQLLLRQVLEALALVGVESVVLPQPVPQLSPFCLQLLNFRLKLAALRLVILELLLLCDLDFLEVEAEVFGHAMEFPEDFVLGHDILHVGADLVVLFGELVEVVVRDGCLVADVLGVHQQGRVLVLAGHLLEPQR